MTTERVIFGNTFEGLYRFVSPGLPPDHAERLRRATGVDFTKPLHPAYPADSFVRVVREMAGQLYADAPEAERLRRVGRAVLEGWRLTLVGRAVEGVSRVVGPLRTFRMAGRKFRTSDNFTDVRVEEVGARELLLHLNDALGMPTYYQGFFEAIVAHLGVPAPRVDVARAEAPGVTLRVTWAER